MYSESVSLCLLEIGTEGRDTTLRALAVFESGSRLRLDKRRGDLNSVVEVGSYDILLLGGGASAVFDLLRTGSVLCQTMNRDGNIRMNQICILGHSA
jgi:hypothetical protein